jgi:peptidoglycan L-alanyl-D-glutamate endopeptidase CwlK
MMRQLQAPVGVNGMNFRQDVLTVQTLLKSKRCDPGPLDGICGTKTVSAIRKFQASFSNQITGLVEPGRRTWLKLVGTGAEPATLHNHEWDGDSFQWSEEQKLRSMHPDLRQKIQTVLQALKKRGYKPKIDNAWRARSVQAKPVQQGRSRVQFSFHNAQKPDGTPNAYAADIIDTRYGWRPEAATSGFWKALGGEAKKQGLYWGGDWPKFRDLAHVQLLPSTELNRIRRESGL